MHKFKLGQLVELRQTRVIYAPPGPHEIVRLLPEDSGVPLYRLRSREENHERVAKETELRPYA